MINQQQIHIGTRLRTNKGEIITVESISTKRQHRKVGYHLPDDPYRIKYVRICECNEIVETPITIELLKENGWALSNRCYSPLSHPDYAYIQKGWYAQFRFGRNQLDIWANYDAIIGGDTYPDVSVRVCPTAEKLAMAFHIAGIDYKLKV